MHKRNSLDLIAALHSSIFFYKEIILQVFFEVEQNRDNWQLKDFLRSQGVSIAAIRAVKFCENGISINNVRANTTARVKTGDKISFLVAQNKETSVIPQDIPMNILYESENVMIVDKPYQMPVHPTRGHVDGTLANAFCGLMDKRGTPMPFRAVNRLDKNTSGLVLLALNSFSVPYLAKTVQKEYFAIVQGNLAQDKGTINAPIARSDDSIITRRISSDGKIAITDFEVVERVPNYTLVKAIPITGRTHQIRVHFMHLGHSLAGDDMYGGSKELIDRHALHCGTITFCEPLKNNVVTIKSALPQDMQLVLNSAKTSKNTQL